MKKDMPMIVGYSLGCIFVIGIVIGIGYLGFNLLKDAFAPRPWKGMFFPDASKAGYTSVTKDFKTLEECRAWANNEAEKESLSADVWSYECGKNCIINSKKSLGDYSTYDCEMITK